jgi:hypothetical protein
MMRLLCYDRFEYLQGLVHTTRVKEVLSVEDEILEWRRMHAVVLSQRERRS